jgi:hypothetical protein
MNSDNSINFMLLLLPKFMLIPDLMCDGSYFVNICKVHNVQICQFYHKLSAIEGDCKNMFTAFM